ncbi:hypothetical protein F5B17DRAFT_384494 [Nemania serpens]|nr:hypothetical protein F5B17DRAFT_384494 [Nemania serpens]
MRAPPICFSTLNLSTLFLLFLYPSTIFFSLLPVDRGFIYIASISFLLSFLCSLTAVTITLVSNSLFYCPFLPITLLLLLAESSIVHNFISVQVARSVRELILLETRLYVRRDQQSAVIIWFG